MTDFKPFFSASPPLVTSPAWEEAVGDGAGEDAVIVVLRQDGPTMLALAQMWVSAHFPVHPANLNSWPSPPRSKCACRWRSAPGCHQAQPRLRHDVQRCIPDLSGTPESRTWKSTPGPIAEVHHGFLLCRVPRLCGHSPWSRFSCRTGRPGPRSKWSTREVADEATRAEIGGSQRRLTTRRS